MGRQRYTERLLFKSRVVARVFLRLRLFGLILCVLPATHGAHLVEANVFDIFTDLSNLHTRAPPWCLQREVCNLQTRHDARFVRWDVKVLRLHTVWSVH